MTNELALKQMLEWWRRLPDQKRPGHKCNFRLDPRHIETYLLDLREYWQACGPGIMNLAVPHRERLERRGRGAFEDYRRWLLTVKEAFRAAPDGIESGLVGDMLRWAAESDKELAEAAREPLAKPFGLTLGASLGSTLLNSFRWWAAVEGLDIGPGGPFVRIPASALSDIEDCHNNEKSSPFSRLWVSLVRDLPSSVQEVQYLQARSPWTATYLLNWLLSDKGILRPSSMAPLFDGPPAVPHARLWVDQMEPVFADWYESSLQSCGQTSEVAHALFSFAPSAYIVRPGEDHLDLRPAIKRVGFPVPVMAGKCCVFEVLLTQIAGLEVVTDRRNSAQAVPSLILVDGRRSGTVAVQVGTDAQPRSIIKGVATLLQVLGELGVAKRVLAARVKELKAKVPEVAPFLTQGKKDGNYYVSIKAPALRGTVRWECSSPPKQ